MAEPSSNPERPDTNPSIDEVAAAVTESIGRELPCPCCGHTAWGQFEDQPAAVVTTPARPTDYGGWLAGFFAVRFYCKRCGFVRLHVVSPSKVAREG